MANKTNKYVQKSSKSKSQKTAALQNNNTLSQQDKINDIYDWINSAKNDMKEIKQKLALLDNSVNSLTRAIISNEDSNRTNIEQLIDSISVLVKTMVIEIDDYSNER